MKRKTRKTRKPWAIERLLAVTGGDDPAFLPSKMNAFASALLAHLVAREAVQYFDGQATVRLVLMLGLGVCFAASFSRHVRDFAFFGALLLIGFKFIYFFPFNSNHFMVEFACLLFITMAYRPDGSHFDALTQILKWIPVLIWFYSGFQKMIIGTYFDGSFFAYLVSTEPRFKEAFQWILSEGEFLRVSTLRPPGPYGFESWLPVVLSNLVYLSEMAVGILLLIKRARLLGFLGGMALIVAIEVVAREMFFGILFVNLQLLYAPKDWNRKLLPLTYASYVLLVTMKMGLIPEFDFN